MREKQTEWPGLEHYADVPLFNTKAVAQQTGIAAPTLRAWERRYVILSPERAHNDYRLYSERDIVIIRWLKEHIDAGMSISQAIALFRHLEEEHNQLIKYFTSRCRYQLSMVKAKRLLKVMSKRGGQMKKGASQLPTI